MTNVSREKRCSTQGCAHPARPNQRTCGACHRIYMRAWRKKQRETLMAYRALIENVKQDGAASIARQKAEKGAS